MDLCKKLKKIFIYLLPAIFVFLIMSLIFLYKGIYPFGEKLVLQIDADYNYVPTYFKIYDIFHYGDSILWDFKLGSGANLYGSLIVNSFYSPLNWIVALTDRNNICNFFSIILIIKFSMMATTMFVFIRHNFKKVSLYWQIIFSLLYVFSGWGFLMFSNIYYIDTIILFPIIMLYFIRLFKYKKPLGLILTLSFSLIMNYYLSYMIYLFIVFCSLIAIVLLVKKEEKNKIIMYLSFSLVIPPIISSFSWVPSLIQVLSSQRVSGEVVAASYFYYFFLKCSYLLMSSLIIVMFFKWIKNFNEDKNTKLFYLLIFLLTSIGIIIEPINRIWHTGSYSCFPYRYSFITIFVLICGSLKYLSAFKNKTTGNDKNKIIAIIFILLCISIFIYNFNDIIINELIGFDIIKPGIFVTIVIIFSFFVICHNLCFKISNEKKFKVINALLIVIEIFVYSNWCFNDYKYDQSNRAIYYKEKLNMEENELYKYVDYQGLSGPNSSYITRNATLANWFHIIPSEQKDFIKKFGYSYASELIYGYGGTIFSDYLLGTKNIISAIELPSDIYHLEKEFNYQEDKLYFYTLENNIPFGIIYDEEIDEPNNDIGFFEMQNYYYRKLFDTEKDIIKIKKFNFSDFEQIKEFEYEINLLNKDSKILYLEVTENLLKSGLMSLKINDNEYTIGNSKKIVYLDYFKTGTNINIKIKLNEKIKVENLDELIFGYIEIEDYNNLVKANETKYNSFKFKKNKLNIDIDATKESYLFLPINNIDGWQIKINGQETNINNIMDIFMSIKLNEGNNIIEMKFVSPYLKESTFISLSGIIVLLIFILTKEKLSNLKIINKIITFMYYFISISLFIFIYIISNFIFI